MAVSEAQKRASVKYMREKTKHVHHALIPRRRGDLRVASGAAEQVGLRQGSDSLVLDQYHPDW